MEVFRRDIGGCDVSAKHRPRVALAAGDLFCLPDAKVEKDEGVDLKEITPPSDGVVV